MTPINDIEIGARVEWRSRGLIGHRNRGTVTTKTKATVTITPDYDRAAVKLRANRDGLVDVRLLTDHEVAEETWRGMEPETRILQVVLPENRRDDYRLYAEVAALGADLTGDLEQIEKEAGALRVWLNLRPTAPAEVNEDEDE